jgi:hypothetical protein
MAFLVPSQFPEARSFSSRFGQLSANFVSLGIAERAES